ncbi:MAG: hypothetical protein AB7N65_19810 [Vicinamibacterales bacterium]
MSTPPDVPLRVPQTAPPAPDRPAVDAENPWPGLAFFEEKDRQFFHGRDEERRALVELIAHEDLVLLYGPSGLGKTSLLRAGVIPSLPPTLLPVYLRLEFRHDADLTVQVFEAVERAARERRVEVPPRPPSGTLWEYFRRRDPACAFWGPDDQLVLPLLVFDQFEQLFTRDQDAMPQAVVDEFLTDLGDLVHGRIPGWLTQRVSAGGVRERFFFDSPGCRTVLSFREDFLADVARLTMLVPSIDRNALRLEPMKWTDAVRAVRQAGEAILAPLPAGTDPGGPEDVAAAIVDIVAGRDRTRLPVASIFVEPAILSVFCSELNERRKARVADGGPPLIDAALVGTQDASRIIARFYGRAVERVPAGIRTLIESRLVIPPTATAPTGARDSVAYEELSESQREAVAPLINEWRILRLEPVGRQRQLRLELTHDVLVRPVLDERRRSEERAKAEADAAARERQVQERIERARQERLELEARLEQQRLEQRRVRRWLTAMGIIAGIAVLAGLAAYISLQLAWEEREQARLERDVSRRLALGPDILQITEFARTGRHAEALAKAAALARADPDNRSARDLAANLLLHNRWWLPLTRSTRIIDGGGCLSLFSPNGTRGLTSCRFGGIVLWNAETGALVAALGTTGGLSAAFSPDGRRVVTGSDDGVVIWDAESGNAERRLALGGPGGRPAAEFSPDGAALVTVSDTTQPTIWSTETWQPIRTLRHPGPVSAAHFTADSKAVVTATALGGVGARVWSLDGARPPQAVTSTDCADALVSRSGQHLVCVRTTGLELFTRSAHGTLERQPWFQGQSFGAIASVQWGHDDQLLSVQDGVVKLWTLDALVSPGGVVLPLAPGIQGATFDPSGRYVLSGSTPIDGRPIVQVFDTRTFRLVSSVVSDEGAVMGQLDIDGRRMVTTSEHGDLRIWRAVTDGDRPVDLGAARRVQFTASNRWVVVEGNDGQLRVRNPATGAETAPSPPELAAADGQYTTFAANDADRLIAVTGAMALAYDVTTDGGLQPVASAPIRCDSPDSVNPDAAALDRVGETVALECGGRAMAWHVATGDVVTQQGEPPVDPIVWLEISGDGTLMAVTRTESVHLIETANGRVRSEFRSTSDGPQSGTFVSAIFSPDDQELIVTTAGGSVERRRLDGTLIRSVSVGGTPYWIWFTGDPDRLGTTSVDPPAIRLWSRTADDTRKPLLAPTTITDFSVSRRDEPGTTRQRVLTLFDQNRFTVLGVQTLYPETGELYTEGASRAQISPDGSRVAVIGATRTVIVNVPRTARQDVDWLVRAAEDTTGLTIVSFDLMRRPDDWFDKLQARRTAPVVQAGSLQAKIEGWLFGAPGAGGH